jgi:AcrR family transcriptional regulator
VPRALDHDEQRQQLALRCAPLFAQRGYAGLNMRTIAAELGVSTGVLYHYFASKAALFESVVRVVVETDVDTGTRLLRQAAKTPSERLGILLHFMDRDMSRFVQHYRVLVEFSSQLESDEEDRQWTAVISGLRARYARAIGEVLELARDDQRDLVLLTTCGLILRAMCGDRTTNLDRVAASLGRALGWE